MYKLVLIAIVFMLGLYFTSSYTSKQIIEGFTVSKTSCPNILIQKDKELYLYNSRQARIPGVNPVVFNNLEDYVEFLDWQRSQNINCPVLFLQHSYDAQGKPVYHVRPSPTDLQGGLPPILTYGSDSQALPLHLQQSEQPITKLIDSNRNDPPYNDNSYPGYDPINLYQGDYTPLDKMFNEQEKTSVKSTNAMDINWGGATYTADAVKAGEFKEDEVKIYIP